MLWDVMFIENSYQLHGDQSNSASPFVDYFPPAEHHRRLFLHVCVLVYISFVFLFSFFLNGAVVSRDSALHHPVVFAAHDRAVLSGLYSGE